MAVTQKPWGDWTLTASTADFTFGSQIVISLSAEGHRRGKWTRGFITEANRRAIISFLATHAVKTRLSIFEMGARE